MLSTFFKNVKPLSNCIVQCIAYFTNIFTVLIAFNNLHILSENLNLKAQCHEIFITFFANQLSVVQIEISYEPFGILCLLHEVTPIWKRLPGTLNTGESFICKFPEHAWHNCLMKNRPKAKHNFCSYTYFIELIVYFKIKKQILLIFFVSFSPYVTANTYRMQ